MQRDTSDVLPSPPCFDDSMSIVSTSSLQYLNTQLVAHGFVSPPGLTLDGIQDTNLNRVVKCLLGMLSQRVEDISRTEDLMTRLRTLTYDHERLRSLHKDAMEAAANAERETNLHKSRLLAVSRSLKASEVAHKQTTAELQRTRNILQGIRAAHQSEIKKKEKDYERMAEKWLKLADAQSKLMMTPSGMRCANAAIYSGAELIGKTKNYLEVALEEAEKARIQLGEDNAVLKRLVLTAVNEMQTIIYQARPPAMENAERSAHTLTSLFPLYSPGNASDNLDAVLGYLRETVTSLSQASIVVTKPTPLLVSVTASDGEIQRLQNVITTLREKLEQSRQQTTKQVVDTQAMISKFATDQRNNARNIGEASIELIPVALCDAEKERLDNIRRDLDEERQKLINAALKLEKDRTELEAERIKLLDQKRSWQVEMMLAEPPPTPLVSSSHKATSQRSPRKSPGKSPAKVRVKKTHDGIGKRMTRLSRRSSPSSTVVPAYETEVLPPLPAPTFSTKPLATPLLPTSFVLPPPSPHASLPAQLPLLPSVILSKGIVDQSSPEDATPPSPSPSQLDVTPNNPMLRCFPVAKPLAQRMIHAYSPVKPSPLSRILQLGNSPDSVDHVSTDRDSLLGPVLEEGEHVVDLEAEVKKLVPSLESPLQEKKLEANVITFPVTNTRGQKAFDIKQLKPNEQSKEGTLSVVNGRGKTARSVEKENNTIKIGNRRAFKALSKVSPPSVVDKTRKIVKPPPKTDLSCMSKVKSGANILPSTGAGPRRVLVNNEEAPTVVSGRRR